jgi:PEP-CTERM motif
MKKFTLLSLFAVLFLATVASAQCVAPCIFYSGDYDPNNPNANGLANETDAIVGGNPYGAATYDNFKIDATSGNITGLYTNNLSALSPASGYWEIRAGISEGNGGTLIASGTASGANFSQTATGRSGFGFTEYTDLASGLNINLPYGFYWLAVVPQDPNNANRSFNSNTFGLNQVGIDIPNEQFFNSSFFGANFTNANNEIGDAQAFSAGVVGTVVPEPSSLIMLGSGLVAAAGVVRRRLSR